MTANRKVSRTALLSGATRAIHLIWDEPPHILTDPFTALLLPSDTVDWMVETRLALGDKLIPPMRASLLWRARTTEDALERAMKRGVRQYGILGAGFDSFAWRRTELLPDLRVFEIDHPDTQAWKRECLENKLVKIPNGLTFVPADLSEMRLRDALAQSSWDFGLPGFFCWLGVTMYLDRDAVAAALRDIAALGPGTTVSFSYMQHERFADESERPMLDFLRKSTAEVGEPMINFYASDEIESVARAAGFTTFEHHEPKTSPYFQGRRDGLMSHSLELLMVATV